LGEYFAANLVGLQGIRERSIHIAVTGIGSVQTYIYNSKTGQLSTKDGSADEFVNYFNGDLSAEASQELNGYDVKKKHNIETLMQMVYQTGSFKGLGFDIDPTMEEYEITCEQVSGEESRYTVNGDKVLTQYIPMCLSYKDMAGWGKNIPFKTVESKGYDPETNSMNLAVGDVFDLGNGYRLRVAEDCVEVMGYGSGSADTEQRVEGLANAMNALIHFADQQWPSIYIWPEYTPMLLSMLGELGLDMSKEFTLNGTKCVVEGGQIREAGNKWVMPSTAHDKALKEYEEWLSQPLHARDERR
jgi:hypothetical protein